MKSKTPSQGQNQRASRSFSRNKSARAENPRTPRTETRTPGDARPRYKAAEAKPKFAGKGEGARSSDRSNDRPGKTTGFGKTASYGKPRFDKAEGGKTVGGDRPWSKHRPDRKTDARPFDKKFKPRGARPERAAPAPIREPFRTAPDAVLIWGLHAARAAWLNPKRRITRAWLSEAGAKSFATTRDAAKADLLKRPDPATGEREAMGGMLPPGSVHQGIVIEVMPLPEPSLHDIIKTDPPPSLILLLDQVTDPHNVGAILRSAAAFGAGAVVLTERNAPTATGVMAKSASGALDAIPLTHVVNLARALDDLREAGYWCVGLAEEGAKYLGEADLSGRTVLVLGNEGDGLRHLTRQKCDELAKLPTGGPIGSLNVSNAAAVALYEVRRQGK